MKCCICNGTRYRNVLVTDKRKLVSCSNCGMIFFENFKKVQYEKYDTKNYTRDLPLFYKYLEIFAKVITNHKKKGSLLEIGSGIGILIDIMKKKGWNVEGIEQSKKGVEYAKKQLGVNLIQGDFFTKKLTKKYDVVAANHVIEHIEKINQFLQKIRKNLNNKGIIVLGLPNIDSWDFKLLGKKWPALMPDQHIWQFTPKTITKLLEKNNFRVIEIRKEQPLRKFSTI